MNPEIKHKVDNILRSRKIATLETLLVPCPKNEKGPSPCLTCIDSLVRDLSYQGTTLGCGTSLASNTGIAHQIGIQILIKQTSPIKQN